MADAITHAVDIKTKLHIEADSSLSTQLASITKSIADAVLSSDGYKRASAQIKASGDRTVRPDGTPVDTASSSSSSKEQKDNAQNQGRQLATLASMTQSIATSGMSMVKTGVGILTDMFERIKAASPLLQTVESLFNLAMQLFFMPLGTKLAKELIPSVVKLMDSVMGIWEGFEDKSLGDIMSDTIKLGAKYFGQFFKDIGNDLKSQEGVLGTIGKMLTLLGSIVSEKGEFIVNAILSITSFIVRNIPALIGIITGFMLTTKALQIAQIVTTASITPWSAGVGAAAVASALTISAIGGTAAALAASHFTKAAKGGYFPATSGGVPVLLAEGGEGETVVPDSKKLDFAKSTLDEYIPQVSAKSLQQTASTTNNTYNIYVNGYSGDDIDKKIIRALNSQANLSRIRNGY